MPQTASSRRKEEPVLAPNARDIEGVRSHRLNPAGDIRGSLVEIHRDSWRLSRRPLQWDFIFTRPCVLRGAHVHRLRFDYMVVVDGRARIGLTDIRRDSPTFRQGIAIEVSGTEPEVIVIPPGVVHSIYAHSAMSYLYGLTAYYDGTDQLGCRYDDPGLGVAWPDRDPVQIERDAALPDFETLIRQFEDAGGVAVTD